MNDPVPIMRRENVYLCTSILALLSLVIWRMVFPDLPMMAPIISEGTRMRSGSSDVESIVGAAAIPPTAPTNAPSPGRVSMTTSMTTTTVSGSDEDGEGDANEGAPFPSRLWRENGEKIKNSRKDAKKK